MMGDFMLGDPVTITDHLVRAEMNGYQATLIADAWDDFPAAISEPARVGLAKYVESTGHEPRSWSSYGTYKVWVPQSVFSQVALTRVWLKLDSRRHPTPHPESLKFPLRGIITRAVAIQDGAPDNDSEYGANWNCMETRPGFQVAYHLSRRPLLVLPQMISDGTS